MSRRTQNAPPPTWAQISSYFKQIDIDHMGPGKGHVPGAPIIDLTDCATVLKNAQAIYNSVYNNLMPPGGPYWSDAMCADFAAWMVSANPCGKAVNVEPKAENVEPAIAPVACNTPTWACIKTYFTPLDIAKMGPGKGHASGAPIIDLTSCKDVLKNAAAIFNAVNNEVMPPGGPFWTDDQVNNFQAWMNSVNPCGT